MADPLKKLFKHIQEGMEGLADAVLGERAERLLEDEISAIDDELHRARGEHAAAKARRIANDLHQAALGEQLLATEAKVESALRGRRTQQARAAAEQVVKVEVQRNEKLSQGRELAGIEQQYAHVLEQLEARLRRLKHQRDILRASTRLQRAQATVARRQPGDATYPEPAFASAQRMKRRATDTSTRQPGNTDPPLEDPAQAVLARAEKRIKSSPRKR